MGLYPRPSSLRVNPAKPAISLFNACYPTKRLTKTEATYAFEVLDANQNGAIDYIELQSVFACHILRENDLALLNEFKRVDVVYPPNPEQ